MRTIPIVRIISCLIILSPIIPGLHLIAVSDASTLPSASVARGSSKNKGNGERGRTIFHGRGFCFKCHGQDGYLGQRPEMDPAITRMIENLNPKPADLRNPAALKSKNEAKRFISIRDGHRGTAMFPKKDLLSDQDIYDILAYLAILRSQGPVQKRKGP